MNLDGNREDRREINHQLQDGKIGEAKERLVGEEEGLLEGDKVNGIPEDVNDGNVGAVQAPAVLQIPQPQPQTATAVCWERFLHVQTIRVLLVETDVSTRHVVTALLRNCSYEVTEAANGIQAWKILEDLNNHIDLVLTEVVMPFLSGIGLLCKILSHKTRRNIPVIMMSSHDSMGLVFKCLSKGAVDFLVKPIRKNELKNLWQHVWRRCQSSSGSGSESATQTQKSVKSKSVEKSDNNTRSTDEEESGSIGLNIDDGSDDGSGTQSSWTKQAVEVESPRPESQCDRVDSTCAQVIHSNAEISGNKLVAVPTELREQDEQLENATTGRDLEIGGPRDVSLQIEHKVEAPNKLTSTKQDILPEIGCSKWNMQMNKGQLDLNSESPCRILKPEAGASFITKSSNLQDKRDFDASNMLCKRLDIGNTVFNTTEELTCLEHSSKRHRGVKDGVTSPRDDRNVLRRSESSAFSRYNPASNFNKPSCGNAGSNSLFDSSQDVKKKGSVCDIRSNLNDDLPNQHSNVGSNNIDMGSTTDNTFTKPGALKNSSAASSSIKQSVFQPCSSSQQVILDKANDMMTTTSIVQPSQQLPHHHCDHNHFAHNAQQQLPHCGSSNVYGGVVEGNTVNYSVNGSVSGSNHGSNGPNGSSTAVNVGGANMESDNAGKSGSGSGSGNRLDQNKMSRREAALMKFRQKRKERCFRKKVRYQSRKRLAEQRPRVRGQFVRKTATEEDTSRAEES